MVQTPPNIPKYSIVPPEFPKGQDPLAVANRKLEAGKNLENSGRFIIDKEAIKNKALAAAADSMVAAIAGIESNPYKALAAKELNRVDSPITDKDPGPRLS